MSLPTHPDAVLLPAGKVGGNAGEKHLRIKKILAPVLACNRVWTRKTPIGEFVYPNVRADGSIAPHVAPNHPIGHPRQRQEAFAWHVATQDRKTGKWTVDETVLSSGAAATDKVRFGYAKPDAVPDGDDDTLVDPDEVEAVGAETDAAPVAAPVVTPVVANPPVFKAAQASTSAPSTEN